MEAHGDDLRQVTGDDKLVQDVKADFEQADLDEKTKALLRFICKVTHEPAGIREADVQTLRDAGWEDKGILEGVLVAGLFGYFNRVADALGIDLEEGMPPHPSAS
jgi:uncharacterized peroxidase-related enzyme